MSTAGRSSSRRIGFDVALAIGVPTLPLAILAAWLLGRYLKVRSEQTAHLLASLERERQEAAAQRGPQPDEVRAPPDQSDDAQGQPDGGEGGQHDAQAGTQDDGLAGDEDDNADDVEGSAYRTGRTRRRAEDCDGEAPVIVGGSATRELVMLRR